MILTMAEQERQPTESRAAQLAKWASFETAKLAGKKLFKRTTKFAAQKLTALAVRLGLDALIAGATAGVGLVVFETGRLLLKGAKWLGHQALNGFKKIIGGLALWGEKKAQDTIPTLSQSLSQISVKKAAGLTILGFTFSPVLFIFIILLLAFFVLGGTLPVGPTQQSKQQVFLEETRSQIPEFPGNSPYIRLEKTANHLRLDNSQALTHTPITYTLTLATTSESLTNLRFEESITKHTKTDSLEIERDINGRLISSYFQNLPDLAVGEAHTIQFTLGTDETFKDSRLFNQIKVTADIPSLGLKNQVAQKRFTVYIGNPTTCALCRDFPLKSPLLAEVFNDAAEKFGVPASVLLGVAHFEGRFMKSLDDAEVEKRLQEGFASPENCQPNFCGARGPMQFLSGEGVDPDRCPQAVGINIWQSYQNAVRVAEGQERRTPHICNLMDAIYAAAAKLGNDASSVNDQTARKCHQIKGAAGQISQEECPTAAPIDCADWSKGDVYHAIAHWYGNCTANYCSTIYNGYYQEYSCLP